MRTYLLRRAAQTPVLVIAAICVLFLLIHLAPGDPTAVLIGDVAVPPDYVEELRHHLGLDRSMPEQLGLYISAVVRGDLGYSFYYSEPVLNLIVERLPPTLLLMTTALIAATLLGLALAVVAAANTNSVADTVADLATLVGYSLPVFWLGELALLFFALQLGWFPSQGLTDLRSTQSGVAALVDRIRHLALPAAVLGTRYLALDFRLTRSGLLEALSQDYVLTARAKGLGERTVLIGHALRNALLPLVTITGLNFGFALSGAVLTEVVFGWPGIGRLTLDAIGHRDYPVLMGIFLMVTIGVVLVNFITDLVYAAVDPRIRIR